MINTFLSQSNKTFFRLSEIQNKALVKLGIHTLNDILYHFPTRYEHSSNAKLIRDILPGDTVTVYGKISQLRTGTSFKNKTAKAEGVVNDDTGKIKVLWFHQPYIARLIQNDSLVKIYGKVSEKSGTLSILNPEIKPISVLPNTIGDSLFGKDDTSSHFPVYTESKGITSKWFFYAVQKIFKHPDFLTIQDPLPEYIRTKYSLPTLQTALIWLHTPQKENDSIVAKKRFAFEEIFYIQLKNAETREKHSREKSFVIEKSQSDIDSFVQRLPFQPTEGQVTSINDILNDFKKGHPMSRLLEGDVGSGKTAVAAVTTYAAVSSTPKGQNYGTLQVAYMAPTEILAKQHFESFITYFKHMPISIGLITGTGCRKFPSKVNPGGWTDISRSQFTKWVAQGEISVVIGTHALIQKTVGFKHLAYVIIDEQHRFGTAQRQKLTKKNSLLPHLLSMTATPIPRTLALTIYGDLDLSLLDQMPTGRKKAITTIVKPSGRESMYSHIKTLLDEGRQTYIICPRINEPDPDVEQKILLRSVKEEATRLKKGIFKNYRIDIMHSKMKPHEKDAVMKRFEEHEIDILVSTSVIEVGVNVPNATSIIIEGGDRFGLSQLHQLRGRVMRGSHQPYCYVCTESEHAKTSERLNALVTAKNGFELSELDLKLRGTGELYGPKQWGISDIAMEAIKNIKMVEAARKEAYELVKNFSGNISKENSIFFKEYPSLAEHLHNKKEVHME